MRRWILFMATAALLAAGCGSDSSTAAPTTTDPPTTTVSDTAPTEPDSPANTPPETSAPASTAPKPSAPDTSAPETTVTEPPVEDPATITNPDRPWVLAARDDLVARSGINIEAANCVFDRLEREGFDLRRLVWSDQSTPLPISVTIGLCGSSLTGGFDLPDETNTTAQDYGDNPLLDQLWDWCEAGDGPACEELWWQSDSDSPYEAFASSCGDRGGSDANCLGLLPASSYGDSMLLDQAYDSCTDGYGFSCDELHFLDSGSDYKTYGQTCGGRIPAEEDPICTDVIASPAS